MTPTNEQSGPSAAPPQSPALTEMRAMLARMERLEAENARLRSLRQGPLGEDEINIGTHVAARVGLEYVSAEVTDIYTSTTGARLYALKRLDDGRKGLSPKEAGDLFPPERATSGS